MPRTDDSAALALNWRTVLAFDLALGVLVTLAGLVVAVMVNVVVGVAVVAIGAGYTALVGSRIRRWSRIRRAAGL